MSTDIGVILTILSAIFGRVTGGIEADMNIIDLESAPPIALNQYAAKPNAAPKTILTM